MQETVNYNVGIYARLSRDNERSGERVSIENQKELLTRYVRKQGWNSTRHTATMESVGLPSTVLRSIS